MSKTARVPEPSMEEILASIRRIIADDSGNPSAASAPMPKPGAELNQTDVDALLATGEAHPAAEAEVLELTQAVDSPGFTAVRGPDVMFREERPQPAPPPAVEPPPAAPEPAPRRVPAPRKEPELMSASSSASVSAAFNSLAATVLSDQARTLEDIVKEMMRPMLRQWLDDNLPGLVERMVRAEIERVSRGGR